MDAQPRKRGRPKKVKDEPITKLDAHGIRYGLDDNRKRWDRQPGERDKHYSYFLFYLMMPKPREVRAVATHFNLAPSTIIKASQRWWWKERAMVYDETLIENVMTQQIDEYTRLDKKLIADEQSDYEMMLEDWRRMYQHAISNNDLKAVATLTHLRDQIDIIGRRSVGMPKTYKDNAGGNKIKDHDGPLTLGWHDAPLTIPGRVNESDNSPAPAREAADYQE